VLLRLLDRVHALDLYIHGTTRYPSLGHIFAWRYHASPLVFLLHIQKFEKTTQKFEYYSSFHLCLSLVGNWLWRTERVWVGVVFIDRLVSLVFMYELGILAFGQAGWIPAVHCERKQWKGRKSNLVRCC